MKFEEQATLLSAESKPYDFNGNSGTSHKMRFAIEGEIYAFSVKESQVQEFQSSVKKTGTLIFQITSRKESVKLEFLNFKV